MNRKTCLITGGNAGIGFAAAVQFARLGYTVIIACRNTERGIEAQKKIQSESRNSSVCFLHLDMSSQSSIRSASEVLNSSYDKIDILIHNAADFDISRNKPIYTDENIESVWATNHIGPVLLTRLLLGLLMKSESGKILTVTSKGLLMHPTLRINQSDPEYRNSSFRVAKAYYQSKLAQEMYTFWLAEELKGTNVTVNCVRVTNVKIDIGRYPGISPLMKWLYSIKSIFSISPKNMAETYVYVVTSDLLLDVSGKFYDEKRNEIYSSKYIHRSDEIAQLKQTTERFIRKA